MTQEETVVQSKYLPDITNAHISDSGLEKLMGMYLSQTVVDKDIIKEYFIDSKDTRDLPTRVFQTVIMAVISTMHMQPAETSSETCDDGCSGCSGDCGC